MNRLTTAFVGIAGSLWALAAGAASLQFPSVPLNLGEQADPMVMITMGRDQTLSYEAYTDAVDINGDGKLEPHERFYTPKRDHLGLFDSYGCYTYDSSNNRFIAQRNANADTKACGGAGEWSGDFLNYLTTSRLDAIRKVLYGGTRITDTAALTVLQAAYVPRDAHSWGKLYDPAIHGPSATGPNAIAAEYRFSIRDYTPYNDGRHIFARTSKGMRALVADDRIPVIRIWQNVPAEYNVWNWVGQGRQDASDVGNPDINVGRWTVATNYIIGSNNKSKVALTGIETYQVNVEACTGAAAYTPDLNITSDIDKECHNYNGVKKPVGLLQRAGTGLGGTSVLKFGLLTGSYLKSLSGGVLRKAVSSFTDEVNDDGTFKNVNGIIKTLDTLRISRFGEGGSGAKANTTYGGCALITDKSLVDLRHGEALGSKSCQDWGNPLAGMMFETLRYFAGTKAASANFAVGSNPENVASGMTLPLATWDDPYASGTNDAKARYCSPAYNLVISTNPTYDSMDVPGSSFSNEGGATSDAGNDSGVNFSASASSLMAIINSDAGFGSQNVIVGDAIGVTEGVLAPTLKTASSLFGLRGLAPDDPTKYGSYYSAAVAYFGNVTDLRQEADMPTDRQRLKTIAAGMANPLPKFTVTAADGSKITIVPFGKIAHERTSGKSINKGENTFQPTMTITDYYIESMTATSGKVRVNFEDVEQGFDHDMDAIVLYEYRLVGDTNIKHKYHPTDAAYNSAGGKTAPAVEVKITPLFVEATLEMHAGYVVSGSHADGVYLEIAQTTASGDEAAEAYHLDTLVNDASGRQDLAYPNNFRKKDNNTTKLPVDAAECTVPEEPKLHAFVRVSDQNWGNGEPLHMWAFGIGGAGNYWSGGFPGEKIVEGKNAFNGAVKLSDDYFQFTFTKNTDGGAAAKPTSGNVIFANNGGCGAPDCQTATLNISASSPQCFLLKDKILQSGNACPNAPKEYKQAVKNVTDWPLFNAAPYNGDAEKWMADKCAGTGRTKYFHFNSASSMVELPTPLWFVGKYGWFTDQNGNNKPDLAEEWQEQSGERAGQPKGYFQITDGSSLKKGLTAAIVQVQQDADSQLSAINFSTGSATTNTLIYLAEFVAGNWEGNVKAIDISGYDPEKNQRLVDLPLKWEAKETFKLLRNNHGNRIVFSHNPESNKGIRFKATNSNYFDNGYNAPESFSESQLNQLIGNFGGTAAQKRSELGKRLDYWRGSNQFEGKPYRPRNTPLGDITDSQPLLINEDQGLTSAVLAVGANDGMLHVIDATATGGNPIFSYVPSQVYGKLPELLDTYYSHRTFVNGQQVARKLGDSGPALLVGALGSGGRGLYALDLTEASKGSLDSDAAAQKVVKWEFTPDDDKDALTDLSDVGFIFGKPAITRLKMGSADKWVVITHNGYNSDDNNAVLYVLDAATGALLKKIDTGATAATGTANGLSEILVTDVNQDGYGDLVYAGDLQGNLWGFDLTSSSSSDWSVMHQSGSKGAPLFTARYPLASNNELIQPISGAPSVVRHPQGGSMVVFGTGKFLEPVDVVVPSTPDASQPVNSFYAVHDSYTKDWDGITPSELASKRDRTPISDGRDALQQQTITAVINDDNGQPSKRLTSDTDVDYDKKSGWYLDLLEGNNLSNFNGERQVSGSSIRFNKVLFTTNIPSDEACLGGGNSWLMEMNVFKGSSWFNPDVNNASELIAAQKEQITNRRIGGIAGKTVTVLAGPKQKELNSTATTIKTADGKPYIDQLVSDPNVIGRQSWIQLFMAPPTQAAAAAE